MSDEAGPSQPSRTAEEETFAALIDHIAAGNVNAVAAALLRRPLPRNRSGALHEARFTCPLAWALLRHQEAQAELAAAGAAMEQRRRCLADYTAIVELLCAVGYCLKVCRDVCRQGEGGVWRMCRLQGLQPEDQERLQLQVGGPFHILLCALRREPWTRSTHATFPRRFRTAAAALLAAASATTNLAHLPEECLDMVLAKAAYPLSAWM